MMDILKKEIQEVKTAKREKQLAEERISKLVQNEVAKRETEIEEEFGLPALRREIEIREEYALLKNTDF